MSTILPSEAMKGLRERKGFTLLELAVVGLIIGILGALAIPGFRQVMRSSQNSIVGNDLRIFAGAFKRYELQHGQWPGSTPAGETIPEGMEGFLGETSWSRRTPIGGSYGWKQSFLHGNEMFEAVIEIGEAQENGIVASRTQLREIDSIIDDGILSTGRFRLGYENQPFYVLGNIIPGPGNDDEA